MPVVEHHIQRDILDRLTHASSLRFSELKPDGMESNIFMYHLKQLMRDGYVQKTDEGYLLTTAGLSYVDLLSGENQRPRPQPKLIAILALHDAAGRWLLAERKIQPYFKTRMFPSGKQHRGETSAEHAVRELAEKTGLENNSLVRKGSAEILIHDAENALITHVVAQVYTGELSPDTLLPETDRFRYVWHDFEKDDAELMAGTRDLYDHLRAGDTGFFVELSL
jgi:8-oxo-dGTP pyrophosphatase MutT (NUDIX family)